MSSDPDRLEIAKRIRNHGLACLHEATCLEQGVEPVLEYWDGQTFRVTNTVMGDDQREDYDRISQYFHRIRPCKHNPEATSQHLWKHVSDVPMSHFFRWLDGDTFIIARIAAIKQDAEGYLADEFSIEFVAANSEEWVFTPSELIKFGVHHSPDGKCNWQPCCR